MRTVARYLGLLSIVCLTASVRGEDKPAAGDKTTTPKTEPASATPSSADEKTLFATWQGDPTTTMCIQWFGKGGHERGKSIDWQKKGDADWKKVAAQEIKMPATDWLVYRSPVDGLSPDTIYRVKLDGSEAVHEFRTAPKTLKSSFTYVCGGDAGVNAAAARCLKIAADQDPAFIMIAGDIAYDNATAPNLWVSFYRQYHETTKRPSNRLIPLVVCIGNHEVKGGFTLRREDAPYYYATFGMYEKQSYAAIDFGDYLSLITLDTGHTCAIDGKQTEWLAKTLEERQKVPHLFVHYHVPAFPSVRPYGVGEKQRKYWVPLFDKFGVDAVFENHDHTFKRTYPIKDMKVDPAGITYFGDGAWGQLRVPKKKESTWYLQAAEAACHIYVNRIVGTSRSHVAISEHNKILDVFPTVNPTPIPVGQTEPAGTASLQE